MKSLLLVFRKFMVRFSSLRPSVKKTIVISLSVLLIAIVVLPLVFSKTQRVHRSIKKALNLQYADPQLEIVEFSDFYDVKLHIHCGVKYHFWTHDEFNGDKHGSTDRCPIFDTTIVTNYRAVDCIFRCKNNSNVWSFYSTTFSFDDNLNIVDPEILYCYHYFEMDDDWRYFKIGDRHYPNNNKELNAVIDIAYDRVEKEIGKLIPHTWEESRGCKDDSKFNDILDEGTKIGKDLVTHAQWYGEQFRKYDLFYTIVTDSYAEPYIYFEFETRESQFPEATERESLYNFDKHGWE